MAELSAGNLYDVNKDLVAKTDKPMKGKALTNLVEKVITPYINEFLVKGTNYLMLLCNENKDYTVFNFSVTPESIPTKIKDFEDILKITLHNRGVIYSMERTEDKVAIEIWVKCDADDEMHCYYLFPYDTAVVEL